MTDSILRLKVESTEYDSKLKSAAEGLSRYIDKCRETGKTLETAEKDTLRYVRSLGEMNTKSKSSVSGFGEMKRAFLELSLQYKGLTDAEKNSKFGQALSAGLVTLRGRINETREAMDQVNQQMRESKGNGWLVKAGAIGTGLMGAKDGLSQLCDLSRSLAAAYAVQEEAELKLATVMRQRMNASDEEVNSIKQLASEQQKIGVVGDEVQLAGAQQVATFLENKKSIEELLPAMNNLAVQQNGLNVTSENMVNIGNMVGKVMQGQTGALRRVGISFTDAQEKALKYGSELDRAKTLAQVITDNVGDMNAQLAKTNAGKAKQMANNFGDWQEEIGKVVSKYETLLQAASQMGIIITSVVQISGAFFTMGKAIVSTNVAQKAFTITQANFAAMGNLVSAAINGQVLSLKALRAGIKGTVVSLGLIGVAYLVVSTAIEEVLKATGLLGDETDNTRKKTENLSDAQSRQAAQAERAASLQKRAAKTAGDAVGDTIGRFKSFQKEWSLLKNTGDQINWIKKNQSAFVDMGLAIGSVNEANRVFVRDSEKVIRALKAIAEAEAYKEEYGKAKIAEAKAERTQSIHSGSHYRIAKPGQRFGNNEMQELVDAGIMSDDEARRHRMHAFTKTSYDVTDGRYALSASDAAKLNAYRRAQARRRREDFLAPSQQEAKFWGGKFEGAERAAQSAQNYIGGLGHAYTEHRDGTKAGVPHGRAEDDIDREIRSNKERMDALSHEYVNASGERRKAIQGEIADLKKRNGAIEDAIAQAKGEVKAIPEEGSKAQLVKQLSELQALQDSTVKGTSKWEEYGSQVNEVRRRLEEYDDTAAEVAKGNSGLNAATIEAWRQGKNSDLDALDFGTDEGMRTAIRIEADTKSMDTLQSAVNDAVANGVALPSDAVSGLYDAIFNTSDIPDAQLQTWVDAINAKLSDMGLGEIDVKTSDDGNGKKIRTLEKGAETTKKGWQAAAQAMQSVGSALQGIEDPAIKVAGIVAEAVANIALSFAQATAKDAKLGVWGWISAIAAGTATMISTISSIKSATRHAAGGIIGGNSPSGDNILMATTGAPALVNSGELVLNRAQQGNLASQLTSNTSPKAGSPYVTGEAIYLGLRNYLRGHGYGDIVTTNR